jgi:uncharacterized membrane protein
VLQKTHILSRFRAIRQFLQKIVLWGRSAEIDRKPEQVFFICSLLFGLITLFITPPFQSPDEYSHFFRAVYTSQGGLIGDQATLPSSIVKLAQVFPLGHLPHHAEAKQNINILIVQFADRFQPTPVATVNINNTIFYSFVPYIPQSIGVYIGTTFSIAPISTFYLGRLFNLLTWILITLIAIHITPIHKWLLVGIALLPMTIFQAASNSTDATVFCLCFLFVAYLMNLIEKENSPNVFEFAGVVFLAILIALCKHIYGLIALMIFLIPPVKFGGFKKAILYSLTCLVLVGIITLSWYSYASSRFIPDHPGSSPTSQILYILKNPTSFGLILLNTIIGSSASWVTMMVGIFGWLDAAMPVFIYSVCPIFLILLCLFDSNPGASLSTYQRSGLFIIFCILFGVIATSMFILWTFPGARWIDGIQGRYFTPFIWLLFLPFFNQRFKQPKILPLLSFFYFIVTLDTMVYSLVMRYYL